MITPDILDIITRTRKGFFMLDNDTGHEILCFERKRTPYVLCFLRDIDTKKFKKKLEDFRMHFVAVFERCYPHGCRKGKGCSPSNNLHVECHNWANIIPREFDSIEDMIMDLQDILDELASECDNCFDKYGVEPDKVDILFHSIEEGGYECLMDRCM